ncbi:ATP-binding protein [Sphingomonas ginkgonis]|uniref:ATP-binding protein n=1 Tax=Sphingomonas ginkgonis TaxID=2315330 RepID=UPI001EF0A13C|nr:ATP-binding protein [Sphingomonas ginkgonis]
MGSLIEGMADLIASTSGPRVHVELDVARDLAPAQADANQVEMALLNLSVNARDAMPEGGSLTIAAAVEQVSKGHRADLAPGQYVRIAVSDTGRGMDETTMARAAEPFFSTKGIGKGTGLGLSMVHGLAAQLGGAIAIGSKLGLGTTVELWLPASQENSVVPEAVLVEPNLEKFGTVLLVDDEDLVRASTSDMLAEQGYVVIEASSAEEALLLINDGLALDLLVTDHLMPGMSGTELIRHLRAEQPDLSALVISGYADLEGIAPDVPRLVKPFRRADMAMAIAEVTFSNNK